jgi:hypothetical protein
MNYWFVDLTIYSKSSIGYGLSNKWKSLMVVQLFILEESQIQSDLIDKLKTLFKTENCSKMLLHFKNRWRTSSSLLIEKEELSLKNTFFVLTKKIPQSKRINM